MIKLELPWAVYRGIVKRKLRPEVMNLQVITVLIIDRYLPEKSIPAI